MEVVRVSGLSVAYERAGTGRCSCSCTAPRTTGASGGLKSTRWPVSSRLSPGTSRGSGRSSDVPAGFGITGYASCLAGLIEALALGPAHVAGLSWGGTVTLELYRHRPELVATLILADTYAGWKGSLPEDEVRARVAGARRMLAAPREEFDPTFPGLFAGEPPPRFVPLLRDIAADVRRDSLMTQLLVMADIDQRDLLPRIAVPTLLIWGELDARSPLSVARQFQRTIPDATLVILPQAGHLSNLDQPARFNAAVRTFCRAHPLCGRKP